MGGGDASALYRYPNGNPIRGSRVCVNRELGSIAHWLDKNFLCYWARLYIIARTRGFHSFIN